MVGISSPTPGPWDYVPSTEHHGPYVTSEFGTTVADCYVMSRPGSLSVRNGGDSKPIHHMAEMADANARLIAAAPDLLEALADLAEAARNACNAAQHTPLVEALANADAALAKATERR